MEETLASSLQGENLISRKPKDQIADLKKLFKEALIPTSKNEIETQKGSAGGKREKTVTNNDLSDQPERATAETRKTHPVLNLSKEVKRNLSSQWERPLIVRIYDGTKNVQTAKRRLQSLWKIGMQFHIKEMGKRFFIVYDLSENERMSVIAGRPWKLGSSPITIRSWKQDFSHIFFQFLVIKTS